MSLEASVLAQLDECKGLFAPEAARRTEGLLKQIRGIRFGAALKDRRFESASALIHLHETLLFLRAYPQSAEVVRLCDAILFDFARWVRRVPREQLAEFEYAEVSGIAGTGSPRISVTSSRSHWRSGMAGRRSAEESDARLHSTALN